jgi:hypothetical protein
MSLHIDCQLPDLFESKFAIHCPLPAHENYESIGPWQHGLVWCGERHFCANTCGNA